MVKALSKDIKNAIVGAVAEGERRTSAEIVAVVAQVSDGYQGMTMLYGLMLGSVIDLALWAGKGVTAFPELLTIQLLAMTLLTFVPYLRLSCARLVPKPLRHQRAARRAFEEYLSVSRRLPSTTPVVLFYVSLAERYAHILPCRIIRDYVPDATWEIILNEFRFAIAMGNEREAYTKTIGHIADQLAPFFPEMGQGHYSVDDFIEIAG